MCHMYHAGHQTVTIPPADRDPDLTDKLKAEWPGILAWAIDGCTNWREMGLCPPKAVLDATDEYLSEQDTLAEFIKDYCETEQQHWARSRHLFAAWKAFATSHNERIGTQKAFTQKLKALGFKTGHDRDGTKFLGIQPKPGMEQV